MSLWIETKVRYEKTQDNGRTKRVTESYLVDAMSFTEAEARITAEVRPFISGEFSVSAVKKCKLSEVLYDARGDRYFKVKINFITLDEKTATEKRSASYLLVQAADFRSAYDNFIDSMKGSAADYEIEAIAETKIMDVFKAQVKE